MKSSIGLLFIGFIALALAAISHNEPISAQAQGNFPNVPRWEYKVLEVPSNTSDDQLNSLGAEGWELVSSAPQNGAPVTLLYFKRPRP